MARRRVDLPAPKTAADLPLSLIDAEIARRQAAGNAALTGTPSRPPLYDFTAAAWRYIDQNKFLPNWHLQAKGELLQAVSDGQADRVIINEPPGLGKSKFSSVCWPSWEWGPAGKPQTRWLCVSYGGSDEAPAVRDAGYMRNLIDSPWYQAGWGTAFEWDVAQNAKTFFRNSKLGYRVSVGLDGGIPGQRADRILIDDPSNPTDIFSVTALRKPIDVWEHALRHRIVDEGSAVVLIMHRLHDDDLTGYFLKSDGWLHLRLPQFYEAQFKSRVFLGDRLVTEDRRETEGQPLHPLMTKAVRDATEQMRDRPDIAAGQQQQRPAPLEGTTIRVAWIQHWAELPNYIDDMLITVDCAFKDGEKNSFVVMQCWARRHAQAFLLDQWRKHLDLPGTIDALAAFAEKWPKATAKYVEAKANGLGVVQMLRRDLPGLVTTDDDEDVLKPFCAQSKDAKLASVAPYFRARNVFLPTDGALDQDGKSWVKDYVHEITTFPKAPHDDQVDATAMGLWRLLYSVASHAKVASVLQDDAGNIGNLKGVFDVAYAGALGLGVADMERGAFGGGLSVADMARGAFGS